MAAIIPQLAKVAVSDLFKILIDSGILAFEADIADSAPGAHDVQFWLQQVI